MIGVVLQVIKTYTCSTVTHLFDDWCCTTGDYGIHIKYNDEHIPNSPAFVHIAPESKDAALVTVHGLKDRGLDVRHVTTTK